MSTSQYICDGLRPLSESDLKRCIDENLSAVKDHSYGCFVIAKNSDRVLMIRPIINGKASDGWGFPKGHPDENEAPALAARRETIEETHVEPDRIYSNVSKTVGYSFIKRMHNDKWKQHPAYPSEEKRPILCYHKQVTYYLAEVDEEKKVGASDETAEVQWVPLVEVSGRVPFDEEKRVTLFFQGVQAGRKLEQDNTTHI